MEHFLGIPTKKFILTNKNSINLNNDFNFKTFSSVVYYCFTEKIPCILSNQTDIVFKDKVGVYFIYNSNELFFTWDYIISLNLFFTRYNIKDNFTIKNNNFYYIFLLSFIYKNKRAFKSRGMELLGDNAFFGFYDSYNSNFNCCQHYLYFSYNLQKFIFYKVFSNSEKLCGKLMKYFKIKNDKIVYKNNKGEQVPASLSKIKKGVYSINKRNISIITKNTIDVSVKNKTYCDFLNNNNNRSLFILNVQYTFSKRIIEYLYEFIIKKYPILENTNNKILINPRQINIIPCNLVLILLTNKTENKLVIDINQYFINYVGNIYSCITEFFSLIKKTNKILIKSDVLQYNKDYCVHIVSEVMYTWLIVKYLWLIQKNIKISDSDIYIQANYSFTKKEIATFKLYAKNIDFNEYLKYLISTILGTFLDYYYLYINDRNNIDIIPIYEGIDITTIKKYISYSRKANYSKYILNTYISKMFGLLENNIDIPIVFFNITKINNDPKINLYKIYGNTNTKSFPIIINLAYGEDKLLINISYKKKYNKMKYFFNELIENILSK